MEQSNANDTEAMDSARATIEDIILSAGKHNQEQCIEIADAILRELPSLSGESAVWMKASERLPENPGFYCFRVNGGYMGAYYHIKDNVKWWSDISFATIRNWKNGEWLDESSEKKEVKS